MKNALVYLVCVVALFGLGLAAGGALVWLYRDNMAIDAANQSQADAIATVVAAAPKIAAQIDALRQAQRASNDVASEFAALRPALASLADCRLPDDYVRVLSAQDRAINAAGSDAGNAGLPKD